jgi:response regulator receiver protein
MDMNQPVSVLLVDDDAMVRTGLRMILGGTAEVSIAGEAENGAVALEAVGKTRPDVVLLDVRMPVLDGLATAERLLSQPNPPAIIMLTTFNTDDYVLRALKAGARGFLLKDTSPAEMLDAIRRAAAGEPVLSPQVAGQVIAAATAQERVDAAAKQNLDSLTTRERDVARLLAEGRSNQDIAHELYMILATVKANITRIFLKLEVDNRVAAAMRIRDGGGIPKD